MVNNRRKRNGNNHTVEKRDAFIVALQEKGSVYHASQAVGIARCTAYQWRKRFPGFAKDWDAAIEDAADTLEASLYERGMIKDTTAAIFWLKGHRPEKYRETTRHELLRVDVEKEVREAAEREGFDADAAVATAKRIVKENQWA